MQSISSLLDKFKNLTNHNLAAREITKEILESEFYIKVSKDQLKLRGGILSVKVSGPAKAELFLRKDSLIKKINERLGIEAVVKII